MKNWLVTFAHTHTHTSCHMTVLMWGDDEKAFMAKQEVETGQEQTDSAKENS